MSESKNTWSKEAGYIWSMIGSAVGFANVLSFSALCYKNGGGAFLIPYIIAHLVVGIPMLFLEGLVGQRFGLPLVSALGKIKHQFKFFGWLSVLTCATIGGFYMVLTGFSVAYTYFSAVGGISHDTAYFFKSHFLQDSGHLLTIGGVASGVFVSTLIVAVIAWFVLMRNIQAGIEKICTYFLPLLGCLMFAFTIAVCFLPGAFDGFKHYLVPHFSYLSNWTIWRDVFGQVFFSLSLGLGIVAGYSRHNPSSFNIRRAMIRVALGDFIISFISGFAIFGCMGFMSAKCGLPFDTLVTSDSAFEIGFVIFPMILDQFGPIARIIGPLFFFCVFIAGITGLFSIVESVAGNIEVEFQKTRRVAVGLAMVIITLIAFPFCFGNGQHLLGALAPMVLGNSMLIGGITEIIIFLLCSQIISKNALWQRGNGKDYSYFALKYFVLPLLCVTFSATLVNELKGNFGVNECVRWLWFLGIAILAIFLTRKQTAQRHSIPATDH